MSQQMSDAKKAARESALITERVRAEPFVYNGTTYMMVQMTPLQQQRLQNVKDDFDRIIRVIIQGTHVAVPVMNGSEQAIETYQEPVLEEVVDGDGVTRKDQFGRPVKRVKLDEEGNPVLETRQRLLFEPGEQVFEETDKPVILKKPLLVSVAIAAINRLTVKWDEEVASAKKA